MMLTELIKSLMIVILLLCPLLNLIEGCRTKCSDYASNIANGYVSCTDYNYVGSKCNYYCYSSHQLVGASSLYCQSNGYWDDPKPQCKVKCGDYATYIANGMVSCTDFNIKDSKCYYYCDSSHQLVGASSLYCQSNGDWDNPKPQCKALCSTDRTSLPHGAASCTDSNVEGSFCSYYCFSGYVLKGSQWATCLSSTYWDNPRPVCKELCSTNSTSLPNGGASCTDSNVEGSVCSYYCFSGYVLKGSRWATCLSSTYWDNPRPVCKGITTCGNRPFDHMDNFNLMRAERSPDDVKDHGLSLFGAGYHSSKIIGGRVATHGSIPWQARLSMKSNSNKFDHQCGGIVIAEHWVLTAAHCLINVRESHLRVVVGEHSIKKHDEGEQTFGVEKIIMHTLFNGTTYNNDIALLKVKPGNGEGIQFNDFVQPACLPRRETEYTAGTTCLISGWGNMNRTGSIVYPDVLMEADALLIADDICEARLSSVGAKFNRSNMLCAGSVSGEVDTCSGDSGGPLVCHMEGFYTVLGVTSWGVGCGQANLPGVYTRVKEFLPWTIEQILANSKLEELEEMSRYPGRF